MEIQLQELIEQIKKDGVDAAEARAEEILKAARAEAERIIVDAKVNADKIISDAKNENLKAVKSGEDAIRQAGRNLLISFRESVSKEINAIVNSNVNSVFASDALAGLIINAVKCWTAKPDAENISVILNSADLEKLEAVLIFELNEMLQKGVTLKASNNFDGGFRIALNNGSIYYDYSAEAVTDMLSAYLSPRIAAIMKEAE